MPVSLSELLADRRPCSFTYLGHEINFTYKPGAYTAKVANDGMFFTDFVVALVTDWDVLDDQGTPIPIDGETVAGLPQQFLRALSVAIREDVNLGEAEGS